MAISDTERNEKYINQKQNRKLRTYSQVPYRSMVTCATKGVFDQKTENCPFIAAGSEMKSFHLESSIEVSHPGEIALNRNYKQHT